MALAYLLDPCLQHQNRAGVNNVDGWFEVFRMDTDDRATIYTDFSGTLAPARNVIDNNGRVVMIAESGVAYRVAMYLPNGELVYTQQPVFTVGSGGGAGGSTEITSSDGSINVDKTSVGSDTTFDITVARDGTDLLEYVRCDGATQIPDSYIYRPTYTEGTIMVGEQGLVLSAGHYYHVTAHVRATKSVQRDPFYDEINIRFVIDDGTSQTDCVVEKRIVDYSIGLSQEFEVSTDVMPSSNCELLFVIDGHDVQNGSFELLDVEAHKVYSGSPSIPSGVLSRVQAASIYQEKLIAGTNITIEDNVISATGGGGGSTYTAGDGIDITNNMISADVDGLTIGIDSTTKKIKLLSAIPTVDQTYSASSVNAQSGVAVASAISTKQDIINDLETIRSGASAGATAVQPGNLSTVAVTGAYSDLSGVPTIPSGDELVPSASSIDAGKVLTVDNNGDPTWVTPSAGTTYTAGDGVDITNNVISADVDGSTIGIDSTTKKIKLLSTIPTVDQTYNASSTNPQSGTAVAGALAAVPTKPLVAGANITLTGNTNDVTIAATNTDTTYTAGNMIAIDANNSNAIGVSTTAGITDIQQVAALPANPVSTVLYLVPET